MPARRSDRETAPRLSAHLRFRDDIDALYEQETGRDRIASLSRSIILGLVLYNIYNITSILLLPDILVMSVALRLLLVTPTSLALIWLIRQVSAIHREVLVTVGMINAITLPIFFFWYSEAPLSAYTFGELALNLVFGNMLLLLRFRFALIFTATSLLLASLAALSKAGLDPRLSAAFVVQIATGCLFSLYANWRTELARCRSYLAELDARLQAEEAENSRKQFEGLSLTDALTGLPNRRALEKRLDAWFREGAPITVMMIDVDHFKLFNDRLGHPAGDDCLRKIAKCLSGVTEPVGAFAARFGGEEFAVILRNGSELEGARLANTIVEAIRSLKIVHPVRSDGFAFVTVSAGIARGQSGRGVAQEALFQAADQALYLAKKRGRNQWVHFDRGGAEMLSSG